MRMHWQAPEHGESLDQPKMVMFHWCFEIEHLFYTATTGEISGVSKTYSSEVGFSSGCFDMF